MPNMTFAVPEAMHKEMRRHSNIKWSEVVRQAIQRQLDDLHWMDKLLERSTLTIEDAVKIGRQINKAAAEAWRAEQRRKKA